MKNHWHPHTELPSVNVSALIAIPDDELDFILLAELFAWNNARGWRAENSLADGSHRTIDHEVFWWCAESDLMRDLADYVNDSNHERATT